MIQASGSWAPGPSAAGAAHICLVRLERPGSK